MLKRKGTASPWTIRHCGEGFLALGHKTGGIELDTFKDKRNLKDNVLEFRPDFFLAINHLGLDIELQDEVDIPAASWFNEDPFYWVRREVASKERVIFVFDKWYIPLLKRFGFEYVYYLPMASNPEIFKKIEIEEDAQIL